MAITIVHAVMFVASLCASLVVASTGLRHQAADVGQLIGGDSCVASLQRHPALEDPAARAMLLHSYMETLGTKQNMSYTDPSIVDSMARMSVGGLRYPGGTVANYWHMNNGTIITPCKDEKLKYNYCEEAQRIAEKYPNYYTPGNFSSLIGSRFEPQPAEGLRVMFDLNLLTIDEDAAAEQIDLLVATIPNASTRVRYIELGNEYYFAMYRPWLINATFYMNKAKKTIARVRQLLPNAKIAAVSAGPPSQDKDGWDNQLSHFTHLVDAVTIHDYTAKMENRSNTKDWEQYALYGPSVIPGYAEKVKRLFGADKEIWMTEFNSFDKSTGAKVAHEIGHTLFQFNYYMAAACESMGFFRVVMTLLWGMRNEYAPHFGMWELPFELNHPEKASYNGMAQLHARFGKLSVDATNNGTCLVFGEADGCPSTDTPHAANISCLRGITFTKATGSVEHVITNGCAFDVTASVPLGHGNTSMVHVSQYLHLQEAPDVSIHECPPSKELWECGPVHPNNRDVSAVHWVNGVAYATVVFAELSVSFVRQPDGNGTSSKQSS